MVVRPKATLVLSQVAVVHNRNVLSFFSILWLRSLIQHLLDGGQTQSDSGAFTGSGDTQSRGTRTGGQSYDDSKTGCKSLFFVFLLHQHLMVLRIYQMDPEAETPKVVMQAVVILNLETTVMEVVDVSIFYSRNHFYSFFSLAQCFSSQTEVRTRDLKANSKVVRLSVIFIAQCI